MGTHFRGISRETRNKKQRRRVSLFGGGRTNILQNVKRRKQLKIAQIYVFAGQAIEGEERRRGKMNPAKDRGELMFASTDQDIAQRVIQILKDTNRSLNSNEVQWALRQLDLKAETDIEDLTQKVQEIGRKRAVEIAKSLWEVFDLPMPLEVESCLQKGGLVFVQWGSRSKGKIEAMLQVNDPQGPAREMHFSLPNYPLSEEWSKLTVWTDGALYEYSWVPFGLRAKEGRAILLVQDQSGLKKLSESVDALHPLFVTMDLGDIGEAIEELAKLKSGKTAVFGDYVMAKNKDSLILRKGPIFGDPYLDGELLAGREVSLTFPGGVEISLRALWGIGAVEVEYVNIRLEGEEVRLEMRRPNAGGVGLPLEKDPITGLIQSKLRREIELFEAGRNPSLDELSPMMLAFIRALAEHEDPFEALTEGRFHAYVAAELFSEL